MSKTIYLYFLLFLFLTLSIIPNATYANPQKKHTDFSAIGIYIGGGTLQSPAELLLIDPYGRKTGYDPITGSVIEEIPNSSYGVDSIDNLVTGEKGPESKVLGVIGTEAGIYQLQIVGTRVENFGININGFDRDAKSSHETFWGTIAPGKVYVYEVNYSPEVGSKIEVTPVNYKFMGFISPKKDGSSVFNLGEEIPVKFQVKDKDGKFPTDVTPKLTLQQYVGGKAIGKPIDATSNDAIDTDKIFRYDAVDKQYIYNLSTKSLSVGTWRLTITLDDGDTYSVLVGLK